MLRGAMPPARMDNVLAEADRLVEGDYGGAMRYGPVRANLLRRPTLPLFKSLDGECPEHETPVVRLPEMHSG